MLSELLILPFAGAGLMVALFLVVLAVLWFLLPFSVFGTKPILRDILRTQREILKELRAQSNPTATEAPTGVPAREVVSSFDEIVTCAGCGRETYGGQEICPHCRQPLRVAPVLFVKP